MKRQAPNKQQFEPRITRISRMRKNSFTSYPCHPRNPRFKGSSISQGALIQVIDFEETDAGAAVLSRQDGAESGLRPPEPTSIFDGQRPSLQVWKYAFHLSTTSRFEVEDFAELIRDGAYDPPHAGSFALAYRASRIRERPLISVSVTSA
jgi:hypothetical protein